METDNKRSFIDKKDLSRNIIKNDLWGEGSKLKSYPDYRFATNIFWNNFAIIDFTTRINDEYYFLLRTRSACVRPVFIISRRSDSPSSFNFHCYVFMRCNNTGKFFQICIHQFDDFKDKSEKSLVLPLFVNLNKARQTTRADQFNRYREETYHLSTVN